MSGIRLAAWFALAVMGCSAAGDDLPRPDVVPAGGAGGAAPQGLVPGDDGVPTQPFGGFDYAAFRGDNRQADGAVDLYLYEGKPTDYVGIWNADFKALEMVAKYHGNPDASWCKLATFANAVPGMDCCDPDATMRWWHGFETVTAGAGGMGGNGGTGGGGAGGAGGATVVPIASCSFTPDSWRVGAALASVGVRGLHITRALTAKELRTEIVNGRPVVARSQGGSLGEGALTVIAGWAPIDGGGDRFLVVREGQGWHWLAYLDITEHREDWLKKWTDSWYRMSSSANGCVSKIDPTCGQ